MYEKRRANKIVAISPNIENIECAGMIGESEYA